MIKRALVLLLVLLTGCGAAEPTPAPSGATAAPTSQSGAASPIPTAAEPATPTSAPTPTAAPDQGGVPVVLATLQTTGGFAGLNQTLIVWSDGKVESSERRLGNKDGQATPEQLARLTAALESPEFKALDSNYGPSGKCCDFFSYALTVGEKSITFLDGEEWPAPLSTVFGILKELEAELK